MNVYESEVTAGYSENEIRRAWCEIRAHCKIVEKKEADLAKSLGHSLMANNACRSSCIVDGNTSFPLLNCQRYLCWNSQPHMLHLHYT